MRIRTSIAAAAGLVTLAALLPVGATTRTVAVGNFSFSPDPLEADPGDEITWTWVQGTHTVTAWSGADFDSLARSAGTFSAPFTGGVIMYRCELHSDLVNGETRCSGMCGVIGEDVGPPPPPTITQPTGEVPVRSPTTFAGTSSGADLITIAEGGQIKGQTHTENDGRWSIAISFPTGVHTLGVFAQSSLGVESEASTLTIEVDATPPATTLTAPGDLTVHTGEVLIEGEASDAGGVTGFSLTLLPLYGEPLSVPVSCTGCGTATATFTATVDPPPGVWRITSKALDGVGNEASAAPLTIVTV